MRKIIIILTSIIVFIANSTAAGPIKIELINDPIPGAPGWE
jgi:hypothetical protein